MTIIKIKNVTNKQNLRINVWNRRLKFKYYGINQF
jgi:hypothetical protein